MWWYIGHPRRWVALSLAFHSCSYGLRRTAVESADTSMRARFHVQGNFRFRGRFEPLSTAQRGLLAIVTVFYRTGPQGHLYPADVILSGYSSTLSELRSRHTRAYISTSLTRLQNWTWPMLPGEVFLTLHSPSPRPHAPLICVSHTHFIILYKPSICYMLYAASLCLRNGFVLLIVYDARTIVWVLTIFVYIGHLFQILNKNGAIVARKFYLVRRKW